MTAPDATTAAAPDPGAAATVHLPVVDVRMQEFALPPAPDLGALTGIHIPPLPTPEEFFAGLPPLPALDLSALISPLMSQMQLLGEGLIAGPWGTGGEADYAGTGGGGGAGGGLSGLFNLSQTLTQSLSTGASALNSLQGQWQGEASDTAQVTGEQIEADKKAVKTQGEQIAATVRAGAGIINHGNMLLKAVASRLATTLAALSPTAVTPAGQAAIVSAIASATAEAEAIIATTEAELVPPTQTMLALSEPVPVRMPPGAEAAQLQKASQLAQQVMEPVQQVMQQMGAGDPTAESAALDYSDELDPYSSGLSAGYGASDASDATSTGLDDLFSDDLAAAWADEGSALGGASALGAAAMLGAAGTMGAAGAMGAMATGAEAAPAAARAATAGAGQPAMMPPPPMGAGAGAARGGGDESHKTPEFLVTAAHGDEVVGDQPDVAPGVLGGTPHPGPAERDDDGVDSTHLSL